MGGALAKSNERDANGKVVLITGCSSGGIGYAIAEEFHRRGANVFATSRRVDTMKGLKEKGMHTLPLDVTSEPSIQAAVKEVTSATGRVDVLVNNAGCGLPGPLAEVPVAKIKQVYDTNLFGALALSQAVIPIMHKQKGGRIINVSSVAGYTYRPFVGTYGSSKAALSAVTNCMRVEMKPLGIGVVLVTPGYIRTNIFSKNVTHIPVLPPSSPFKAMEINIRESYAKRALNQSFPPASDLAKRIADAALSPNPPIRILFGTSALPAVIAGSMPLWLQDFVYSRLFGSGKNL
ncbi:hypothetical protein CLOM_g23167 [Closterium sp. NIES-68]|nr:hypothetical protein CLOM_g23167 [Closterium sp. NIES-68]GJP66434.1 hypothetical protein CLOP_g23368 [Closterium sp. NIES-67]